MIADRAYGSAANIQNLNNKNITAYIPLFSGRSGMSSKFSEYGYSYDKVKDCYYCPDFKQLLPSYIASSAIFYKLKLTSCKSCNMKKTCLLKTHSRTKERYILRSFNQDLYEQQAKFMDQPLFQNAMHERMWKIEGINAEAKNLHGLNRAKYRGIDKVQMQAYMTATVQNLKRFINTFAIILGHLHNYQLYIYKAC